MTKEYMISDERKAELDAVGKFLDETDSHAATIASLRSENERLERELVEASMAELDRLSADARFFGASMFSMMEPGVGKLTFRMIEAVPSPRSQAALDELVAAGMVKVEPFNDHGGRVYTPLVTFRRCKAPPGPWPITVPATLTALKAGETDG